MERVNVRRNVESPFPFKASYNRAASHNSIGFILTFTILWKAGFPRSEEAPRLPFGCVLVFTQLEICQ
jgi:hypothetical protein